MSHKTFNRALELAVDGKHRSIAEIKATLLEEGYSEAHTDLADAAIVRRLKDRLWASWSERKPAP